MTARIRYRQFVDEQRKGSTFVAHYAPDDVVRRVTRDAQTGDTWADPGIGKDLSAYARFTDHIEINILDAFGGKVGGAELICDYTAPTTA